MTKLTHNSFLCIYFNSKHVSSNPVLIIRRINCINTTSGICHSVLVTVSCASRKRSPTESDIYQILYWYNWLSWWWALGCSKHVENWNKYIEKNCASSWSCTKNHNKMDGQQNIKRSINHHDVIPNKQNLHQNCCQNPAPPKSYTDRRLATRSP
jgi:hypothetical protein